MTRIGVDLHKEFARVCLLDEVTGEVREERLPVVGEIEPWRKLVEGVSSPVRILVENTVACFHFADRLEEEGIGEVEVAQADSLPSARNRGRKTDMRDARLLCEVLASPQSYRTCHRPTRQQRMDQGLVGAHRLVVQMYTQVVNWFHAQLTEWGISLPKGQMTLERLRAQMACVPEFLGAIWEKMLGLLEGVMAQRKALEKSIQEEARSREEVKRLTSADGVASIVAMNFVAYMGDPHRFSDGGQVGAFLGLVPWVSQSGDRTHRGRITKIGCAPLRHMLVLAAQAASRVAGPLRDFYLRLRRNKNLYVARTALARKMGVMLWAMWRDGREYNPAG